MLRIAVVLRPGFFACAAMAALAGSARAALFTMNGNMYPVDSVTGAGLQKTILELDFGTNASPIAYQFAYQWNGTQTIQDMMAAIFTGNPSMTEQNFGTEAAPDYFVTTISYLSHTTIDDYPNSWWSFYLSADGSGWSASEFGISESNLVDASFIGWAFETDDPNAPDYPVIPRPLDHTPAAIVAVPEPAAWGVAMAAGILMMGLRRRRS